MLAPDYIQHLTEGAEEIAAELHRDIISRIVERIMTRIGRGDSYILTATDKWQLEVLRDAGFLLEDLQREISQKTKVQLKEMKAAFEDAGVRTLAYDHAIYEAAGLSPASLLQSPNLVRLLQRGYEATAQEWENFTRTTANAAQQLYIRECDRAYHLVSSGLLSYQQAAREAVERIAKDGVTVTYPSGHTDTIETATLRALRTGVSQACGDITDARMDEMGWDIVLTSAHLGARVTKKNDYTNHYWWQGRFFSRSGKDSRFPPFSLCGRGDVQGILGANCRHSYGPGDGKHNPFEKFDSEENQKAYELSQRQRALERRIRKTKREVQALQTALNNAPESCKPELQAAYQKKASLLTKQNKAYNDFCEENDLKRLSDRLSIAKWDRQQAAKARGAARKSVANSSKSDIMVKEKVTGGNSDVQYVGKLDKSIYRCVSEDIVTDEVIITDERIKHIKERHPNDWERFMGYIPQIIADPDYIIEANKPNTAVLLKEVETGSDKFKLILRLKVKSDPVDYKNSVMSFWHIGDTTWKKNLKNKKTLYKKG